MEHTITTSGNTLEIAIKGKFTFSDNRAFAGIIEEVSNKQHTKVIIDLGSTEFIDSAGLGILLLVRDKCEKVGTALVIRNPSGQVKQMFAISRFEDLFKIENVK